MQEVSCILSDQGYWIHALYDAPVVVALGEVVHLLGAEDSHTAAGSRRCGDQRQVLYGSNSV